MKKKTKRMIKYLDEQIELAEELYIKKIKSGIEREELQEIINEYKQAMFAFAYVKFSEFLYQNKSFVIKNGNDKTGGVILSRECVFKEKAFYDCVSDFMDEKEKLIKKICGENVGGHL